MRIQAIIFDLDGTIYSNKNLKRSFIFSKLIFSTYLYKLESSRASIKSSAVNKQVVNKIHQLDDYHDAKILSDLAKHLNPNNPRKAKNWYLNHFYPTFLKSLKPSLVFKHCHEVLSQIQDLGIKTAVLSDYHFVQERLERLKVPLSYFDVCHSAEHAGYLKPNTQGFKQILASLNIDNGHCLIVGDRMDKDGQAAKQLNCPFFHITQSHDWLDLQNYIKENHEKFPC